MDIIIRLIADAAVIPVVVIGVWALVFKVPKERRFESYSRVLMAGLTAYMLAKLAGAVYQPSDLRPFEILGVDAGASYLNNPGFPSDHAVFVMAIACAVWFETRMKRLSIVMFALVAVVCLGRVLALVHTPLDVVAGVAIALIGSLWYSNVSRRGEIHGNGRSYSGQSKSTS